MSRIVSIGSVHLNETLPLKLVIPLIGQTAAEVYQEGELARKEAVDLVEWRLDFFKEVASPLEVSQTFQRLKEILDGIPIILTLRTEAEGGYFPEDWEGYERVLTHLCQLEGAQALDIQYRCPQELRQSLLSQAKKQGLKIVLSSHHTADVPELSHLIHETERMSQLQPDLLKIACQVSLASDVIRLNVLKDHWQMVQPLVVIGMGPLGQATRLAPDNILTFGTIMGNSALGQLTIKELREKLT